MREKRDEIIILRTTKAEKNRIYEKMLGMGIRSLSAYIRKMALDGYCLNLDLPQLRRIFRGKWQRAKVSATKSGQPSST